MAESGSTFSSRYGTRALASKQYQFLLRTTNTSTFSGVKDALCCFAMWPAFENAPSDGPTKNEMRVVHRSNDLHQHGHVTHSVKHQLASVSACLATARNMHAVHRPASRAAACNTTTRKNVSETAKGVEEGTPAKGVEEAHQRKAWKRAHQLLLVWPDITW